VIQYLHTITSHVKVGDVVAPETVLGVTGRTGAEVIHLHVQARDKQGNAMSPDLAFRIGRKKLSPPVKPEEGAGAVTPPNDSVPSPYRHRDTSVTTPGRGRNLDGMLPATSQTG
jgi:hypothetical protein